MPDKVLLTGISGFVAKHVAIELLNSGFEVLGTVRNKNSIEEMLGNLWDTSLTWANIEISYNISSNHRLTVMYGSQRGGVLCSNGVCRYVQPFENGFKIGLIAVL